MRFSTFIESTDIGMPLLNTLIVKNRSVCAKLERHVNKRQKRKDFLCSDWEIFIKLIVLFRPKGMNYTPKGL